MTPNERTQLTYCLYRFYRTFRQMATREADQNAALDMVDLARNDHGNGYKRDGR